VGKERCLKYSDLDRRGVKLKANDIFFRNANAELFTGSYKQRPDQPYFKGSAIRIILNIFYL
jgi:hypothetical protein